VRVPVVLSSSSAVVRAPFGERGGLTVRVLEVHEQHTHYARGHVVDGRRQCHRRGGRVLRLVAAGEGAVNVAVIIVCAWVVWTAGFLFGWFLRSRL